MNKLATQQVIGNIFRLINSKLEKIAVAQYKQEMQESQQVQQQIKTVKAVKQKDSSRIAERIVSVQVAKESDNDYYEQHPKINGETIVGLGEISLIDFDRYR